MKARAPVLESVERRGVRTRELSKDGWDVVEDMLRPRPGRLWRGIPLELRWTGGDRAAVEFEMLVSAVYLRLGYRVEYAAAPEAGPVGDMWIAGPEGRFVARLVPGRRVGEGEVERAADRAVVDEAAGCVVVTTGEFTEAAQGVARARRVGLVDGRSLANMIGEARRGAKKDRCVRARIARWVRGR